MQIPHADEGRICPLHKQDMSKVCHTCPWWTRLQGRHPNTGDPVDEWGCAVSWMPMLLCENSQQSRQTGAAVESFRNVVAEVGNHLLKEVNVRKLT